jgi:hypothetical protein
MMTESASGHSRFDALSVFGADVARWPEASAGEARRALLADPTFRRAWERERSLDRGFAELRRDLDRTIESEAALERVRRVVLARLPERMSPRLHWSRIAAAVVVAALLGGAMDYVLADDSKAISELAMVDPLYAADTTATQ